MSGVRLHLITDSLWFLFFCALWTVGWLAHRRIRFRRPCALLLGLTLLWILGLVNLLEGFTQFRSIPLIGRGLVHNVLHDLLFPITGSLLFLAALLWELNNRSRNLSDISTHMQQLLHNIILSSPEAVVGYDLDNRVTVWNEAAERLFGYTREEAVGREMWDRLAAPEIRDRLREVWAYLRTQGPILDYPSVMMTRDGKRLRLRASCFPIKDGSGSIIGRASIYRPSEEEDHLASLVGTLRDHLDLGRGFTEFADRLKAMVPHDEAMIFSRDEGNEGVRLHVSTNTIPHLDLLPVSSAPTSFLIQALQRHLKRIDDISQLSDPAEKNILEMSHIQSCIALPLEDSHGTPGVLALFSTRRAAFTQDHERILRLLARHLGPALADMQLFLALSNLEGSQTESDDQTHDGVLLVSADDGLLVSAGESTRQMLGLPALSADSYRLADLIPPESAINAEKLLRRARQGKSFFEEVEISSPDGRRIWTEVRGKSLTLGGRIYALLMFRDITGRRRLYQELVEREQRYRFLLESVGQISDIVYLIDAQGKYLYCNKSFQETLGYTIDQFASQPERYLTDNPLNHYWNERARRETRGHEPTPFLLELFDSQGNKVLFEVTEKYLPLQDGTTGVVGVMRNLTERRLLEEQILRDNQELTLLNAHLEELAKVKDQFLANMSHELRTPLNSILGFASLLLEEPGISPKEYREFLESIRQSGRHLLVMINDILDFAKMQSGQIQVHPAPLCLAEVFTEVRSISHVQARQQNLTLTFELPSAQAPLLYAEQGKVVRVLLNLISNAIKFTHEGGVTVRAQFDREPGFALIEVKDTGIGIPPDRQEAVFQAFRQLDGSSTRSHGGTGLGLTISRQLVTLMGGRIWIESEGTGRGTSVFFTLPLASQAAIQPGRPTPDLVSAAG